METPELDKMIASGRTRDGEQVAFKAEALELAALRRRAEDLELMLRAATSHNGTSWLTRNGENFWLNIPPDGRQYGTLMNDGSGLPVLTEEARKELLRCR